LPRKKVNKGGCHKRKEKQKSKISLISALIWRKENVCSKGNGSNKDKKSNNKKGKDVREGGWVSPPPPIKKEKSAGAFCDGRIPRVPHLK